MPFHGPGPGRPSSYTKEIADEICRRLATGEPLATMCRDDDRLPGCTTVYLWRDKYPEFAEALASARSTGLEVMVADTLHIADETGRDTKYIKRQDGSEVEVADTEYIQRSKLRIETRLKLAAIFDPKYRETQKVEHSGSIALGEMTEEDIKAEIANLVGSQAAATLLGEAQDEDDISDLA